MKILHVSYADTGGGAAIGARRIHQALLRKGVDSKLLCVRKASSVNGVYSAFKPLKTFLNKLSISFFWRITQWFHRTGSKHAHSLNIMPTGLHRQINQSDADVVNLHWINNEMISIREIAKIKKPIVWTLHDMWPICGAAHNVLDGYRERFESGFQLPRPKRDSGIDFERWIWNRKKRHWGDLNPFFVGVSSWMVDNVRKSKLFPDAQAIVIPNVVDINRFKPINKEVARQAFDLPLDKKVVLFACTPVPYKGMELLALALRRYTEDKGGDSFLAVAFGHSQGVEELFQGLSIQFLGRLDNEDSVATLYATADVTCVPSQIESFGQTASESMACGIPVVSFSCTGLTDIVEHKENGYLAKPFNVEDFARGIEWVLDRRSEVGRLKTEDGGRKSEGGGQKAEGSEQITYEELCLNARKKVERCFSEEGVAKQYLELYTQILRIGD